jgi:hypothetical protein
MNGINGIFDPSRAAKSAVAGAATAITVLLVGGCASTPPASTPASAQPAQAGGTSHSAEAVQDAASLFGALATPPGAVRLPAAPAGAPALSAKLPPETPVDPDLVERTAWWSTNQSPTALLAWLSADPPAGTTADGSADSAPVGGGTLSTRDFAAPAVPGVISQRLVETSVSGLPGGGSALREDVIVTYLPAKSAAETIPVAAEIDVAPTGPAGRNPATSPGSTASPGGSLTVTDPAEIAEVTSVINGLPAKSAGAVNCPMDNGAGLRLTFRSRPGVELAEVDVAATGCRTVSVTIGGSKQPALSGGDQLTSQIMTVIGANWQLATP